MPHTITRIPGEPVILVSLSGRIEQTTLSDVYIQSIQILQEIDGPACHLVDFRSVTQYEVESSDLVYAIRDGMATLEHSSRVFFAFISTEDIIQKVTYYLTDYGYDVPVFQDLGQAQSYLNLKIDGEYMRQSIRNHTTGNIEETFHVKDKSLFYAQETPVIQRGSAYFPERGILRLEAIAINKEILVFPEKGVLVGRRGKDGTRPDVDLSLWGGAMQGVSRRHAHIELSDPNELQIYDLGSTNGTFLNGQRLEPDHAYLLCDGDELRIGKLAMRVFFQKSIKQIEV